MRKSIFIFYGLLLTAGCSSMQTEHLTYFVYLEESKLSGQDEAYLCVEENRFDFGSISSKKTRNIFIDYEIGNSGNSPLIILKADVSCNCVSVDFPREPILPGNKEILRIKIDTDGQQGSFNKSIYLKSNASNDVELLKLVGQIK